MQATFLCPLVDLFLRGVAKLKKLQDEGFIRFGASLGSIGCLWMRSHYQEQVSLLKLCYLLDQGTRVISHIGYHLNLLSIGSSIFNILG